MNNKISYPIPKAKIEDFKMKSMTRWYNVKQLAATGLKSIISATFGSYADRREIQAAISGNESFDYSSEEDLWVDYVADLGDGFNSTFTVASLLAESSLTNEGLDLPRGRVLIMGGDQVYPFAKREYYEERMGVPYEIAFPKCEEDSSAPHLFAIPGNHDWYDGLANFLKIFCQERAIGNWRSQQHRSYFAIKLSANLWLWGIDIQLEADIDRPQLMYFEKISKQITAGSNIILCNALPSWSFAGDKKKKSYHNLSFFEKKYIVEKGFRLVLSLAGDEHCYARYTGSDSIGPFHKIIAGGGGAFLQPTHNMKGKIEDIREGAMKLEKTFPSKETSYRMLFLNMLFPFKNPDFVVFMGMFYLFLSWMLQSASLYRPIFPKLSKILPAIVNVEPAFEKILQVILYNPSLLILVLAVVLGMVAFADKHAGRLPFAYTASIIHGLGHIFLGLLLMWLLSYVNFNGEKYNLSTISLFSLEMFLIGGFLGSLLLGIYLMTCNLVGLHNKEAFSSLRGTGYKNFLRMHITKDKLTIYPIGIEHAVSWKREGNNIVGIKPEYKPIETPLEIWL
ncbi:MAG TPA: metallophosphoesterase [Cytophagaceae bacterium]|jgi:hypothetical protein